MSHPSRVCGLKSYDVKYDLWCVGVTPFTGVWIEIESVTPYCIGYRVTPFTGVWIEILLRCRDSGLVEVTPFTGVWIEIERALA